MMTKEKQVRAAYADGCLTVGIVGEVDHHSARPLREEIDRHLYLHRPRVFCLSLARVNFMDSSGLGLILGRLALCRELGCPMRLADVDERAARLFRMAGLSRMEGLIIEEVTQKENVR
ncbi:MAG: STAS domain-containing protein [Clostridia bacterium]|nr:STAS domain-containing protein [Clostridia bacterium]